MSSGVPPPPPPSRPSGPPGSTGGSGSLFGAGRGVPPPPPPQRTSALNTGVAGAAASAGGPRPRLAVYAQYANPVPAMTAAATTTTTTAPPPPPPQPQSTLQPPPPPPAARTAAPHVKASPYDFNSQFASTTDAKETVADTVHPPSHQTEEKEEEVVPMSVPAAPERVSAHAVNPFGHTATAAAAPAAEAPVVGHGHTEPPAPPSNPFAKHTVAVPPPPPAPHSHSQPPARTTPTPAQMAPPQSHADVHTGPAHADVSPALPQTASLDAFQQSRDDVSVLTAAAPLSASTDAAFNPFRMPHASTNSSANASAPDLKTVAQLPAALPSSTTPAVVAPGREPREPTKAAEPISAPAVAAGATAASSGGRPPAPRGSSGSRARNQFERLMKREVPAFLRPASSSRTHTPRESNAALHPPPVPPPASANPTLTPADATGAKSDGTRQGFTPTANPVVHIPFTGDASRGGEEDAPLALPRGAPSSVELPLHSAMASRSLVESEPSVSDEFTRTTAMPLQHADSADLDCVLTGGTPGEEHVLAASAAAAAAGAETESKPDPTEDAAHSDERSPTTFSDTVKPTAEMAAPAMTQHPTAVDSEDSHATVAASTTSTLADTGAPPSPPQRTQRPPSLDRVHVDGHADRSHQLPRVFADEDDGQEDGPDDMRALESVSFRPNYAGSEMSPLSRAASALPAYAPPGTGTLAMPTHQADGHVWLAGEVLLNEADCQAAMGTWSPRSGAMEPTPSLLLSEPGTGGPSMATPPMPASPPVQTTTADRLFAVPSLPLHTVATVAMTSSDAMPHTTEAPPSSPPPAPARNPFARATLEATAPPPPPVPSAQPPKAPVVHEDVAAAAAAGPQIHTPRGRLPLPPPGHGTPTNMKTPTWPQQQSGTAHRSARPQTYTLSPYVRGSSAVGAESPTPHAPVDETEEEVEAGDDDLNSKAEHDYNYDDNDDDAQAMEASEGHMHGDDEEDLTAAMVVPDAQYRLSDSRSSTPAGHANAPTMDISANTGSAAGTTVVNPFRTPDPAPAAASASTTSLHQAPPVKPTRVTTQVDDDVTRPSLPPATTTTDAALPQQQQEQQRRRPYAPCFAVFHPRGGAITICANLPGTLVRPSKAGAVPASVTPPHHSKDSVQPVQHRLVALLEGVAAAGTKAPRTTAVGRAYARLLRGVAQSLPFFNSTQTAVTFHSLEQIPSTLWAALQAALPSPMLDVVANVFGDALCPDSSAFQWSKGGGKAIAALLGLGQMDDDAPFGTKVASDEVSEQPPSGAEGRRPRSRRSARSASPRNAQWTAPTAITARAQESQDGAHVTKPSSSHPAIGKRRVGAGGESTNAAGSAAGATSEEEEGEDALAVIQTLLSQGSREAAVEVALRSGLHTHAVIISMMCDSKDLYVKSIRAVVEKELEKSSPLAHAYCLFNELDLPPFAPSDPSPSSASPSSSEPNVKAQREALQHTWRTHAATLTCNYTKQSAEGLIALGDALQQVGLVLEAHTCYLIAHLTPQGSPVWRHGASPERPLRPEQQRTMDDLHARLGVVGGFYNPVTGCRTGFLSLTSTLLTDLIQDARLAIEQRRSEQHSGPDAPPRSHGLPERPRRYALAFHFAQALWLAEAGLVEAAENAMHRLVATLPPPQHALFQGPPCFLDELFFALAELPPPPPQGPTSAGQALPSVADEPHSASASPQPPQQPQGSAPPSDEGRIPSPPMTLGSEMPSSPPPPTPSGHSSQSLPPPPPQQQQQQQRPGPASPPAPAAGPPRPGQAGSDRSAAPLPPPPSKTGGKTAGRSLPPPRLPLPAGPAPGTVERDEHGSPTHAAPPPTRDSAAGPHTNGSDRASPPPGDKPTWSPSSPLPPQQKPPQPLSEPAGRGRAADPKASNADKEKGKPAAAKEEKKPTRSRSMEALLGLFRRGGGDSAGDDKNKKKEEAKPMILDTEKPPKYDPVLGRWMVEETEEEKAQAEMVRRGPPKMPLRAANPPGGAAAAAQGPTDGSAATPQGGAAAPVQASGPGPGPGRPQGIVAPRRGPSGSVGRRQYVDMFNSS